MCEKQVIGKKPWECEVQTRLRGALTVKLHKQQNLQSWDQVCTSKLHCKHSDVTYARINACTMWVQTHKRREESESREESNNSEGDEGQMETPEKHMFSHLYLLETTLNGLDSIREACMWIAQENKKLHGNSRHQQEISNARGDMIATYSIRYRP